MADESKPGLMELSNFSDEDARQVILRAIRLLAILTAIALPLVGWKLGWQSAVLLLVGAAASGSGLWEWLSVLRALIARMDAGGEARPMGRVMLGFFLRLVVVVGALYGSLKLLDGSVYALGAGLGMGVFALSFEGLRLAKAWTV